MNKTHSGALVVFCILLARCLDLFQPREKGQSVEPEATPSWREVHLAAVPHRWTSSRGRCSRPPRGRAAASRTRSCPTSASASASGSRWSALPRATRHKIYRFMVGNDVWRYSINRSITLSDVEISVDLPTDEIASSSLAVQALAPGTTLCERS